MNNTVKVLPKPDASALGEMVNAELSNQIATAKQFPRDEDKSLALLERLATKTDAIAEQCMYTLKRTQKGKNGAKDEIVYITGPSIHFMQLLNYCWGNMRAAARIVDEGEKTVTAQGLAYDLQRNNGLLVEIKRGIVTSGGYRFGQDMINVTSNAACSIAERNAIEDCIPRVLWWDIFELVKAKAIGAAQIPERIQQAVKFFVSKGAKQEDILAALGVKAMEDMGREHLEIFIGLRTAMKEGSIEAAKIFTAEGVEQRQRLSLVSDGEDQFNNIDKQLQGGAKEKGGDPKDAAHKPRSSGRTSEEAQPKTKAAAGKAGSGAKAAAPKAQEGDGQQAERGTAPADASTTGKADSDTSGAGGGSRESEDGEPSKDESRLMDLELAIKEARTGKRTLILQSRDFLEGVADAAPPGPLAMRARKLLNMYDLDDKA